MLSDASRMPVVAGQVLAGKYRVERVLGVGGMGVVVEATHLDLEKRVALKFMLAEAARSGDTLTRFMREGRAAAKLQSEHVARIMDVGRLDSGEPYMVMEFLDGQDLSDVVRAEGPQPIDRAISFVLQACEAIAEAHGIGIVHRDLKPSNLFLTRRADGTPHVKVLDFGISKVTHAQGEQRASADMTSTSAILGSPAYMSPEQLRSSKNVDARTDIWALGTILYELLTRRLPFDAETLPGMIAAISSDQPVPMQSVRSDVPPPLADIIMRCLDKDPGRRFASVAEFATALEPFAPVDHGPLVARIVRVQKTSGLTQMDTTRPPAPSRTDAAEHAASAGSHATEATFGVTAKTSGRSKPVVFGAIGVAGLLLVVGVTAWWTAKGGGSSAGAITSEASVSAAVPVTLAENAVPVDAGTDAQPDAIRDAGQDAAAEEVAASSAASKTGSGVRSTPMGGSGPKLVGAKKEGSGKAPSGAAPPTSAKPKGTLDLSERK